MKKSISQRLRAQYGDISRIVADASQDKIFETVMSNLSEVLPSLWQSIAEAEAAEKSAGEPVADRAVS